MNLRKVLVIFTIYILTVNGCFAQGFSFSEEGPINIGRTLLFQSEVLSEKREILVSLPDGYMSSSKRYPVIYLLDAQYFFEFQYAYGVINALGFLEKIPEVILVGVHSEDRSKDMMTSTSSYEGHADKFVDFFRNELQPFMDQQYRTEPYNILIGQSAGGFFGIYTLIHAPDTFNGYIAIDPALQADGGMLLEELKVVLKEGKEFNNTLFTTLAGVTGDSRTLTEYYNDFFKIITEELPDGLHFSHKVYPDEDHSSSILPGIHDGLLSMYENWIPPVSINSLDTLLSHYQNLSDHYGYKVAVPVAHASDIGFSLISNDDSEGALEVFEYSLANIAQDAIAHYQVAFALRRLGQLTEALAEFNKAIELGAGTDMFTIFVRFRDEVAQEISEQNEL